MTREHEPTQTRKIQPDPFAVRKTLDSNGQGRLRSSSEYVPEFLRVAEEVRQAELARSTESALLNSPETKSLLRSARFGVTLSMWTEMQIIDLGNPPRPIELERDIRSAEFGESDKDTQVKLYTQLTDDIDSTLSRMFRSVMAQWQPLVQEGGVPYDKMEEERIRRREDFQPKDRRGKLEEVREFKTETEDIAVGRFLNYAQSWGDFLSKVGRPDEEIKAEIDILIQRFQASPREVQVRMAFELRERAKNAEEHLFNQLEIKHKSLIRRDVLSESQEGFISTERWAQKFGEADPDLRIAILRSFEYFINKTNKKESERARLKKLIPAPVTVFNPRT